MTDVYGVSPRMTALLRSAGEDQEDRQIRIVLVRGLLEAGADLTLRDAQGWSALHFAVALEDSAPLKMLVWKMPEALKFLNNIGQTPLTSAARFGLPNTVFQLLEIGG